MAVGVSGLPRILLINPNSSDATTAMMVGIARGVVPETISVVGATATRSPPMIVTAEALAAAADEVIEIGMREAGAMAGVIVGAFGDPGLDPLQRQLPIPVVGICEASMLEAATDGRRFGVATTTPDLVAAIGQRARDYGVEHLFTGIRLTAGDPHAVTADAAWLRDALAAAVAQCFDEDGADSVIIGGGPLGQAAEDLAKILARPIIAPIPAAARRVLALMAVQRTNTRAQ
jgi:Asp/Glu/hydantoin racemase